MPDKSHVSMEQHLCLVCSRPYNTGAILLDKRLRQRLERRTLTGWGMCDEHQGNFDAGYIALVAIDESKSTPSGSAMKPQDAWRTGEIAHVKRDVARDLFPSVTIADDLPMMFIDQGVMAELKELQVK